MDGITHLSAPDKRLAKFIRADGKIIDYDSPYRFNASTVQVDGISDIRAMLEKLLRQPSTMVVRGELIAGTSASGVRRLAFPDSETGDQPTLRDVPRRWLALDADGIPRPDHISHTDLLYCADLAIEFLPQAFWGAACIVQATASHGIKPGCRLRLWYWLERGLTGQELKLWLKDTPFDKSVFATVQPIYTAAPIFQKGRVDHLQHRLAEYPGWAWVPCPSPQELAPPAPPPPIPAERLVRGANGDAYARAALIGAADAIMNAGEGNRHATMVSQASSLARLIGAGLLTASELGRVIARAAEHAGKTNAEEIGSILAWALKNPTPGKLPEMRNAA